MTKLLIFWQQIINQRRQPLPLVTTPYRAELERKQKQYVIGFVLLLLLLGWYVYGYTQQKAQQNELVDLVAVNQDLAFPHTLRAQDLKIIQLPQKWVPVGSWNQVEDLVGQTLRRSLVHNEVVVYADVQAALDPKSITAKFSENFAFAVGEDWLSAKLPGLKAADLVDVLATNPKAGLEGTSIIVANAPVIAVQKTGGRKNLVLNLTSQQAQNLLFTRGLRLPMQVVVHSAHQPPVLVKSTSEELEKTTAEVLKKEPKEAQKPKLNFKSNL